MQPLADRRRPYAPTRVVASAEPKAEQTGSLLASRLGLPFSVGGGLHEHDRRGVAHATEHDFRASVAALFREPDRLVFGRETARAARARFATALDAVVSIYPSGSLAVVAHGTVISLYVAARCGVDPFELWQALGLPSFVALSLPDARLLDVVGHI